MRVIRMKAMNFQINQQRRANIESIAVEYLNILAILYGDQIDTGIKRVRDFGQMTMLEAENELRIRTLMIQAQRLRKKRQLYEEHSENERAMLEELKRSKQ